MCIRDSASILVQLRLLTMGDTMVVQGVEYDLQQHVDQFTQLVSDVSTQEQTLEYEGINVSCSPPTLQHELDVNKEVPTVFKNTVDKESVSDIFLVELAKYVNHVKFTNNEINFDELSLKQKVQICEMLPMVLSQQIVEYIEHIREYETPHVELTQGDSTVELPIDSQLFN